ncbi:MAG: serine/threonine-protein kinase [Planctomycetota bacterium]
MSRPFLCDCGSLLDVDEIALGAGFRCPQCSTERQLDPSDPGLLADHEGNDGVYSMLLRRRLADDAPLVDAEPIDSRAANGGSGGNGNGVRTLEDTASAVATPPPVEGSSSLPPAPGLADGDFLGPYRIESILGRGGMGTVFRAFDTSLHRTVALKVLSEEHARNTEVVERFQREARAAGSLSHPNITHIYAIGEERGFNYFAMELVKGATLSDLLRDQRCIGDERAIDYLLQVARGLRAAKEKEIIHRDIKPSNLILSADGLIKITDFGLAKVVTSSVDITATGVIVGTPLYMSPEQGKGEPLDHRSDIYSLGCSFYHLVSGQPPFTGDSAMNIIVRHITEHPPPVEIGEGRTAQRLANIITRMIRKNPLDRFQTYEELIEAVTDAANTGTTSIKLESSTPRRIVLVAEQDEERAPSDSMSRKQLSVADVNLELGRHDKALALYQRVLEENPDLEVDLSFRMLQIYQQRNDVEQARELYRKILRTSEDPKERFFCRWKLLSTAYDSTLTETREARGLLEDLLQDEIPSPVRTKRIRQRLDNLQQLERRIERDREAGIVLIRKSGDLQIELD